MGCDRKGKHKNIQHNLKDSIQVDGMSHRELADIFNSIEVFINYDEYSAYSRFAALCGCRVIIIPNEGITKQDWMPEEYQRYGLSYGFNDECQNNDSEAEKLHLQMETLFR